MMLKFVVLIFVSIVILIYAFSQTVEGFGTYQRPFERENIYSFPYAGVFWPSNGRYIAPLIDKYRLKYV